MIPRRDLESAYIDRIRNEIPISSPEFQLEKDVIIAKGGKAAVYYVYANVDQRDDLEQIFIDGFASKDNYFSFFPQEEWKAPQNKNEKRPTWLRRRSTSYSTMSPFLYSTLHPQQPR